VDPSGLEWLGDPNDPIWIQEYPSSCGPATIVNMLYELFPGANWIPSEQKIREMFEDVMGKVSGRYGKGHNRAIWGRWSMHGREHGVSVVGSGVTMDETLSVLNKILKDKKTGKQYKKINAGSWNLDDMKDGSSKGPVIYKGRHRGSPHCVMLTKVDENTTMEYLGKVITSDFYWTVDPMSTYAILAKTGHMKDYLSLSNSWAEGILVPNW